MAAAPLASEPQLARLRTRLAAAMARRGVSRRELSFRTGYTEAVVSFWLSGSRIPSAEALVKLSRALDVDTDWLLGFDRVGHGYARSAPRDGTVPPPTSRP